jgi:hypothetical protein
MVGHFKILGLYLSEDEKARGKTLYSNIIDGIDIQNQSGEDINIKEEVKTDSVLEKHYITCINEKEHSKTSPTDTFIYKTEKTEIWAYKCSHDHCRDIRTADVFIKYPDWIKYAKPKQSPSQKTKKVNLSEEQIPMPISYTEGKCIILANNRLFKFSATELAKKANLFSIVPNKEYWLNAYPIFSKKGKISDFDIEKAYIDLINKCEKSKIYYDRSKVAGIGIWGDGSDIIINTGYGLIINDEKVSYNKYYNDYKRGKVYVPSDKKLNITDEEASDENIDKYFYMVSKLPFSEIDQIIFSAHNATCFYSGLQERRTHVAIYGPAASGKSTIMRFYQTFYACLNAISGSGSTTEAAIRQRIADDSTVVLLDDQDPTTTGADLKYKDRITAIKELARNAYTGDRMTKGGAQGDFKVYNLFFNLILFSINDAIAMDQDDMRFFKLAIDSNHENYQKWMEPFVYNNKEYENMDIFMDEIANKGSNFYKRIINRLQYFYEIKRIVSVLVRNSIDSVIKNKARLAQNLTEIFTGYFLLFLKKDDLLSLEKSITSTFENKLKQVCVSYRATNAYEDICTDVDAISNLMTQRIDVSGPPMSVGEALHHAFNVGPDQILAGDSLKRIGIKIISNKVHFAIKHPILEDLASKAGILNIKTDLHTMGAQYNKNPIYFTDGVRKRSLFLEASDILETKADTKIEDILLNVDAPSTFTLNLDNI